MNIRVRYTNDLLIRYFISIDKKMMKDPGKKKAPTIYIHFSHKALASLIRIQTHDLVKVK
jgi:hypothetical protein